MPRIRTSSPEQSQQRRKRKTKNKKEDEENKHENKSERTKVRAAKSGAMRKIENLDDSFNLLPNKKPPDAFDLLCLSPMRQEVSFKPLSFWSQKVKDLESKENIKKKKYGLYELSDTDDSNKTNDTSYKGKKRKKKGRPTVGRQKNKIGFDFNAKNLLKKPPIKSKSENKDGSIIRERIILRRLKANIKENEEKFSFKNVTAFGLTSTPGKSSNLNLVGGSTFDFLSPIPKEIPEISNEVHSELEIENNNTKGDDSVNKEITTPRRLRRRKNNQEIVIKDRKGVSGSGNTKINYSIRSNLDKSFYDNIDNSSREMKLFSLNSIDKVLKNYSFEDCDDKLNTSFLYITKDDSNDENENFKIEYYNHLKIFEEMIRILQSLKNFLSHIDKKKKLIDLSCSELKRSFRLPFFNNSLPVEKNHYEEIIEDKSISFENNSNTIINSHNSFSKVTIRRCYNRFSNFRRSIQGENLDLSFHMNNNENSSRLMIDGIMDYPTTKSIHLFNETTNEMIKMKKCLIKKKFTNDEENICDFFINDTKYTENNLKVDIINTNKILKNDKIFDQTNEEIINLDLNYKITKEQMCLMLYLLKILYTYGNSEIELTNFSCCEFRPSPCHHFLSLSLPIDEERRLYASIEEDSVVEDNNVSKYQRNSFSNVTIRRRYNDSSNINHSNSDDNYEYPRNTNNSHINHNNLILNASSLLTEIIDLTMNDTINQKFFTLIEDQQSQGKPTINLMNNIKKRSNQYFSNIKPINPIREHLQFFSVIGNDSSVFISSPDTSTTVNNLNNSISNDFNDKSNILTDKNVSKSRITSIIQDSIPEICKQNIGVKSYLKDKKQMEDNENISFLTNPIKMQQTMNEITMNEDFDLPPPIFESTKYLTPVKRNIDENEAVNSNIDNSMEYKNHFQPETTNITSFRLIPGKKWTKSALILKKSLNGTLMDETVQKGRMYQSLVEKVLNLQTISDGQLHSSDEIGESIIISKMMKKMSNLSINSFIIGNRTVKILDNSEDKEVNNTIRKVFRNSLGMTVVDGINDDLTPEMTLNTEAAKQVLKLCKKNQCLPFEDYFNKTTLKKCKKIGEGTFGEVFMFGLNRVIKIMPIEGSIEVNGEKQKKFDEILTEIVIAKELSNLRKGDNHRTNGFCELKVSWCVKGKYPEYLIDLWNDYDNLFGSENNSPIMFNSDQLYIILEFGHGGKDFEAFVFNTSEQALSVFLQVAFSLAVAEKRLEFEHRDLHWGNILIKTTNKKFFEVVLNGKNFQLPTKGVEVTIIDFTLSRITYDGCCIYNDLSLDPTFFTSEGDYQFEVYRLMKRELGNDWSLFRPKTNIFWLHYIVDKMVKMARYKSNGKIHRINLAKLDEIRSNILEFSDAEHLTMSFQ